MCKSHDVFSPGDAQFKCRLQVFSYFEVKSAPSSNICHMKLERKELSVERDFEIVEATTFHLEVVRKCYDFPFPTDVCGNGNASHICMSLL